MLELKTAKEKRTYVNIEHNDTLCIGNAEISDVM